LFNQKQTKMNIIATTKEIYLGNGNRVFRKVGNNGVVIWTFPNGQKIDDLTSKTIEEVYKKSIETPDVTIDFIDLKEIKVLAPTEPTRFHVMCNDGTGFLVSRFEFDGNQLKLFWD